VTGATSKPSSASWIAGARSSRIGIDPWRSTRSHHPAHAPGTVTVFACSGDHAQPARSPAGERPDPLSAVTARPSKWSAKQSPPSPVEHGSVTASAAAAATAASAAFPPARRIATPVSVANRWLVATMPPRSNTTEAMRPPPRAARRFCCRAHRPVWYL